MSFPTLVYRCPGDHPRPGGTYSIRPICNEDELQHALDGGWYKSLVEAVEGIDAVAKPKIEDPIKPKTKKVRVA